jgi:hypothetical protein
MFQGNSKKALAPQWLALAQWRNGAATFVAASSRSAVSMPKTTSIAKHASFQA